MGLAWNSCDHKMQVAWACSLEGGGGSKSTYGAYPTIMEQDCEKIAKDRSHEGSKKWENV